MKRKKTAGLIKFLLCAVSLASILMGLLSWHLPQAFLRACLLLTGGLLLVVVLLADRFRQDLISDFSNEICETADTLMENRELENFQPYEDTALSKAQGKLLQYYDKMRDEHRQSDEERQTIQELVSDISHQVKTPVSNIQMFTGILRQHELSPEKRNEFLDLMSAQINKLDFLMQSLIKMSRLETGTFSIHMGESRLSDTIAQAVSAVWTKANQKEVQLDVDCDSSIRLRPWQFYTRIDITDTGIGIAEEHYSDVFRRFYRAEEAASEEGVGLGLYLARGIITRQHGYISVKSAQGKGTTFSVYLLN